MRETIKKLVLGAFVAALLVAFFLLDSFRWGCAI